MQDTLPFMEQVVLYDKFKDHMETGGALGFQEHDTVIPMLMCPSDPTNPKLHTFWGGTGTPTQGFSGNVILNAGSDYFRKTADIESADRDGLFFAISEVRIDDIKDGTSHTAMVSELMKASSTLPSFAFLCSNSNRPSNTPPCSEAFDRQSPKGSSRQPRSFL